MKIPETKISLAKYAKAAKAGRKEQLACSQILEMARLIPEAAFMEEAAKALELLGCAANSDQVRAWAAEGTHEGGLMDKKSLHFLCLKAAIGSNLRLKDRGALT